MNHTRILRSQGVSLLALVLTALLPPSSAHAAGDEFLGSWAFELPDGNPAWLQVERTDENLEGSLLWSVGSPRPVTELEVRDGALTFLRKLQWKPFGDADNVQVIDQPLTGRIVDGKLVLRVVQFPEGKPKQAKQFTLTGKRMPPLPPRPNLQQVKFGKPVELFNGRSLDGWRLSNPKKKNGWRVENGELINETPKTDFSSYGEYGNLITVRTFHDFRLTIEYNVARDCNSGVYLRGMYEAQVVDRDSRMQGINGPGAIFGRVKPAKNAAKPGGEWNRYVVTLVNRHVTVVLNGETVIDNQPLVGCTGGGLSADDTAPGPIFLQGDHTSVRYRNIVLEPVVGGENS